MAPKLKPETLDERKAQILSAAWSCFAGKGYNNTTMDDIVAASGLSKGALYWYYESKEALFEAAALGFLSMVGKELFAESDDYEDVSDRLRATARSMARYGREAAFFFGLIVEYWTQSERREHVSQLWSQVLAEYQDLFAQAIEHGVQRGEFRPVEAGHLAWMLMAAYDGLAAYAMLKPDLDLEGISEAFMDVLLNGLMAED